MNRVVKDSGERGPAGSATIQAMSRSVLVLLLLGCESNIKGSALPGLGESCVEEPCIGDLVCGHEGVCLEPGTLGSVEADGDCSDTVECAYGLVCSGENVCVEEGAPGTGVEGDACATDEDCRSGHYCSDAGACVDIGIPYWAGGVCPEDDLEGEFRVLFDVPDLPEPGEVDFFALPFPNDTRLGTSNQPDLSGFPDPGDGTAVAGLVDAIEAGPSGWGLNPTVYFRFSRAHDVDSVTPDTIRWVSLDEDAPDYGDRSNFQYFTRLSRGKYICQNWLAVGVYDGRPLEEGHTYAVWVTKSITDGDGVTAVRDNGMKVMLQEERPADLTLARAWDAYRPLRDYLAREGLDGSEIAGAAVFSTGYPSRGTRYFRDIAEAPTTELAAREVVACDAGVTSPCDDGGTRICEAPGGGFVEVHGRLGVPGYRSATGAVSFEPTTLRPVVEETEEVCFALTVPDGPMPADGWPVAIYATDLDGTFRDAATNGVAEALAAEGVATFSLELPGHGERGGSYVDLTNLEAWLGNQLQATGDPHAALRFLQTWSLGAAESPTGSDLAFDADDVWFVGLGEGASIGINFLAWSLDARGGVLGNPAGFPVHRFADEDHPVDIEHGLMAAFADSAVSRWHPMATLLQQRFELADPVNNGYGVVRESPTESKHLLVVHGVEDEQTPAGSLRAALRALYLPTAGTVIDDYGQSTAARPASENVSTDDGRRTGASVQYAAGHDALLEATGLSATAAFLASGLGGASPTIE